jgi:F-type H+-transporting ATPase subunit b
MILMKSLPAVISLASRSTLLAIFALLMLGTPSYSFGNTAALDDAVVADAVAREPGAEVDDKEHAEGHSPPLLSFDPGAAIWNLIIFMLTLLVLGLFVWPQILAGLQSREDKIQSDFSNAAKANTDAQAALAGYQKQLAEAQTQIQQMLADARQSAEKVGAGIVEQAKTDAERQRARAIADIDSAKTMAISELAGQTSDLAMSLARQVVGRELNQQDHADLIRQSLDKLPSNN